MIVAGHFPVYSVAEHGSTKCLIEKLEPLFRKYSISAYFCGHDHNLQHLKVDGIDYLLSGASNFIDPSTQHKNSVPHGSLKFHWADEFSMGGFGIVETNDDEMIWSFLSAEGKPLYQTTIQPRYKNQTLLLMFPHINGLCKILLLIGIIFAFFTYLDNRMINTNL